MQTHSQRGSQRPAQTVKALARLGLGVALVFLLSASAALGECGDVTNNSAVDAADIAAIRDVAAGLLPGLVVPENCNVIGPADGSDADGNGLPDDCNMADVVVLSRILAALPPGLGDVCCDPPDAFDVAGGCCPLEQIRCSTGLCRPTVECENGACIQGYCQCRRPFAGQTCGVVCEGGSSNSYCGFPTCTGSGSCTNNSVTDTDGVSRVPCFSCLCDSLSPTRDYAGELCQRSGCGVQNFTGRITSDLGPAYLDLGSCEFGMPCDPLPVDFSSTSTTLAFTIEFWIRNRFPWLGGTILKKWGCRNRQFCSAEHAFRTNWQVDIGDANAASFGGSKIYFGSQRGALYESIGDIETADGNLDLWHHVAITYDCCDLATTGLTFYIDGRFDSFISHADRRANFFGDLNRGNLYVLENRQPAVREPAQFELDELRIFPFKKTAAEINATLFSEVDPNQTIYYLRLNEPDPPENGTLREYANDWPTTLDGEFFLQNFSPVFDPTSPVFEGSPRCTTD